jgi:murein DD-endopeptidase MepM/ murein hydrolase activator NlpD
MPNVRKSLIPLTSLLLVGAAATALLCDAAQAQTTVPVRYGTDPGYRGAEAPQVLSFRGEDAPDPVGEIEHVVAAKETVYALARAYDVSPGAIIEKNALAAPYQLQIGQKVLIPSAPNQALPPATRTVSLDRTAVKPVPTPITAPRATRFRQDGYYTVQQGDTLYSLSRRFGLSVADLAAANSLAKPYTISVDQQIVVPGAAVREQTIRQAEAAPTPPPAAEPDQRRLSAKVIKETMAPQNLPELDAGARFSWPVRGPVLVGFGERRGKLKSDGINIAAPIGAPVRATSDGEVVYRGDELDDYGNLLLIRHEGGWVSAYAHTDAILVRKGDFVRQGQVIAKVGRSGDVDRPQLHFQLRKNLDPQDPIVAMQGELASEPLASASLRR